VNSFRDLWDSRDRRWISIPIAALIGLGVWYVVVNVLGPSAAWQQCVEAYSRSDSRADSTRIDAIRPFVRRDMASLNCGAARKLGSAV